MPKLSVSLPKYRLHRSSGQAVVALDGRDFYLGPNGSPASKTLYNRLTSEWLAAGRRLPSRELEQSLTIAELLVRYFEFAKIHYRKHGEPTETLDNIRRPLAARLF